MSRGNPLARTKSRTKNLNRSPKNEICSFWPFDLSPLDHTLSYREELYIPGKMSSRPFQRCLNLSSPRYLDGVTTVCTLVYCARYTCTVQCTLYSVGRTRKRVHGQSAHPKKTRIRVHGMERVKLLPAIKLRVSNASTQYYCHRHLFLTCSDQDSRNWRLWEPKCAVSVPRLDNTTSQGVGNRRNDCCLDAAVPGSVRNCYILQQIEAHACNRTRESICPRPHAHTYVHTHTHAHTCTHMHIHVHTHTHAHSHSTVLSLLQAQSLVETPSLL